MQEISKQAIDLENEFYNFCETRTKEEEKVE